MSAKTRPIKNREDRTFPTADPAFDDFDAWDAMDTSDRQVHLTDSRTQVEQAEAVTDCTPAYRNEREATRPRSTSIRANRYAGTCPLCGQNVPAEAGKLIKVGDKWGAQHLDGQCPEAAPVTNRVVCKNTITMPTADVPAGFYAIVSTGDNDLAFYEVDRPTKGKWAGYTFVKLIVGGQDGRNVRRDQQAGILNRIAEAGITESGVLFARKMQACYACNRNLTNVVSRVSGIGPTCAGKHGVARPTHTEALALAAAEGLDVTDCDDFEVA